MAVTQVIEHKRDSSKALKQDGEYLIPTSQYTRYFQVVVDNPATAHADIYEHASIPKLFEIHPEFDGVICKRIRPEQGDDDSSYVYDVTAEYDDEYNGADPEEPDDGNPLNRPVIIQGSSNETEEEVYRDVDGTLVRNSAGDPFDPTVMRKAGGFRFSMSKNYATLNLSFLRQYKNAINSDIWNGFPIGTVRIANINFSRQVEPWQVSEDTTIKMVFWTISFEFELAEEEFGGDGTWRKYVPDRGYRYYVGDDFWPVTDKYGQAASEPAFLDGSGNIGSPSSPVFRSFNIYRSLPFVALGLL